MSAAACHILATKVTMIDTWPDVGGITTELPRGGFTGSDHHNVATEKYPVGTKVRYYDTTSKGWVTMIYLKLAYPNASVAIAAGQVMRIAGVTDNTSLYQYVVNNDSTDTLYATGTGPTCIALSAMTSLYYGWFWCGGACPQITKAYCSGLAAANIPCYWDVASVTAGVVCTSGTNAAGTANAFILAASYAASVCAQVNSVATND